MTTNRTRKTATSPRTPRKKAESASTPTPDKTPEVPQPMDPGAPEATRNDDVQAHAPFSARNCWAIDVLIAEVKALYPEVTYYGSEVADRGVTVAVVFEAWDNEHDGVDIPLPQVLACVEADERVAEVTADDAMDATWVAVRMYANPVTMDTRDEFGISQAYSIMARA